MSPARFALILATGLAVSCTALAHSELHSASWCSSGIVAYAGEFSFTPEELQAELNRRQQAGRIRCAEAGETDTGGVGTCGIFDPPYETAVAMARAACGAPGSPTPAFDSPVVAFVVDPPTFNDPSHHESFNFDAGLRGICGVCVSGPAIPAPRDQN